MRTKRREKGGKERRGMLMRRKKGVSGRRGWSEKGKENVREGQDGEEEQMRRKEERRGKKVLPCECYISLWK